jgi:transcriptional regulator with XRE-family HTH domain
MGEQVAVRRIAELFRRLRLDRGISQLQAADHAGVNASVVARAEAGSDAKLSTWDKLFAGLGYRLQLCAEEPAEEAGELLDEERERRLARRTAGLCAGKRRFQ